MKHSTTTAILSALLMAHAAYAAANSTPSMGKPPKVEWDVSRLTESDLASGPAIIHFKTDRDAPQVTIRPTPSLTRYLDVQPSGYSDVVAGVWYEVTVDVIGGGPLESTVGGTIQIRGANGVLAQPLNVSIQADSSGESDPGPGPDGNPGGIGNIDDDGPEEDDDGQNTIVWSLSVLEADHFDNGELISIDFSVSRDLGKVCVWGTPSIANDLTILPTMFDPLVAADSTGAPIVYTLDIQLNQPVAELTSNLGGTVHLRDCSSGKLKRTFDTPLPVNIVVSPEAEDAESAPAAVVSAAGFSEGPIAPNQIISIFGEGIGPRNLAVFVVENDAVGVNLGDTIVLVDNVPAPLLATQFGQVNAIVPSAAAGKKSVELRVIHRGKMSQPFLLAVVPAAPAIFTIDEFGQGAILNSNGSVNGNRNPARRGTVVTVFGTGAGIADESLEDGTVLNQPIPFAGDVEVTIDGVPATVLWAGAPAEAVNGVFQINLMVPSSGMRPGIWPIVVKIDGHEGKSGAKIAIQ